MHLHCCYGVCKSDSRKPEEGVIFLPFPKPKKFPETAKRWVHLCARDNFTVKKINRFTYICSKHFPDGEVLNVKANPTLEPFNARKQFKKKAKERRKVLKGEQNDNAAKNKENANNALSLAAAAVNGIAPAPPPPPPDSNGDSKVDSALADSPGSVDVPPPPPKIDIVDEEKIMI